MLRYLFFVLLALLSVGLCAQRSFKEQETFSLNLIGGYQSLPSPDDLNTALLANKFTAVSTPNLAFGIEFAVAGKRDIGKVQFKGTGFFVSDDTKTATIKTMNISLQYGRDVLPNASRTYLYPFAGLRMFDNSLYGQATDSKTLKAWKVNFDFLAGVGLKQFLNGDLRGVFNNVDLDIGISLPFINGKWGKDGAEFVASTYKHKTTYFLTFTIGKGFRPAAVRD